MTDDTSPPTEGESSFEGTSDVSALGGPGALSRRQFLRTSAGAGAGALALGSMGTAAAATVVDETCYADCTITVADRAFDVINNQWSTTDVTQCASIYGDDTFGWDWDRGSTSSGEPNYPQIVYGNKPWGGHATNQSQFPLQRQDISQLELSFDVTMDASTGEWNLNEEWWLCENKPEDGKDVSSSLTHEVMLVLEWSDAHDHGTPIETSAFTDAYGNTYDYWANYSSGGTNADFHIFRVQGGVTTGNVDLTEIMAYMSNNVSSIDGTLWMPGVELGTEYWDNTNATVTFNQFDVTVNGTTTSAVSSSTNTGTNTGTQAPYGRDTGWPIPGRIEAEDFDEGGPDVSYYDTVPCNQGAAYRSDDVDVESSSAVTSGFNVGYVQTDEWLEYTVDVESNATYTIKAHVASGGGGGAFHVEVDGTDVTGSQTVTDTGGWQSWASVNAGNVDLTAGEHVVRVYADSGGWNFDYVSFDEATGDTTSPTAPSNLSSPSKTDTAIDLDWDASSDTGGSGLDHYDVYVDGSPTEQVAAGTTATSVSGLAADTSYDFYLKAVDGAGNTSSASNTITVTTNTSDGGSDGGSTSDGLVLNDYDGSPAWPGGNDLGNWAGAGSFENGGGSGTVTNGALRLDYSGGGWLQSYVSQDVSDHTYLNLRVRGDSGGEETDFSVSLGSAGDVLANLTSDTIGTSFSTVSIDMTANGMDPTSPGDFYLDFWAGNYGNSAVEIDEVWFDSGSSSDGTTTDSTAPTAPANLSSPAKTETSVDLDWDASTDDGGSGLDHYDVYVNGSVDHQVAAGTTATTVSSLTADTSYDFYVKAVDGAGNVSAASNTETVTTDSTSDTTAPTAPTNLSSPAHGENSVDLDWDASTDDGGSGLDHYDVYVEGAIDHQVAAGTTATTVSSLSADTNYDFHVEAVDGAGNASTASNTITVTTDAAADTSAPTAPSNLSSPAKTETSVDLDWDASSDTGGSGLDHYNVYVGGTKDHQVAAGTTSTTASSLSSGTSYDFYVEAVDGAGNVSSASNTLTVTTSSSSDGGSTTGSLLVNDYDGSPAWPGGNDLGNWEGAGNFDSSGVSNGALRLDYSGGGWFQSYVRQDVSEYTHVKMRVRGDNGGEESHFQFQLGNSGDVLANLTSDSIGTSYSTISIDMAANGLDTSPDDVYFDFWKGDYASSAIEVDEIWFE